MADINLLFRQGTLQQLESAEKIAGSVNFTTDEPAIYIDVPNELGTDTIRKRIGDLIIVQTASDLMSNTETMTGVADGALVGSWSTTALYYIEDEGALLKWNGTVWKQLNTLSDVEGDISDVKTTVGEQGLAITSINTNITNINGLIGSLPEGTEATTIVGYVDEKSGAVDEKVTSLNSELDTLSGNFSSLSTEFGEYKQSTNGSITSLQEKDGQIETQINDLETAYKAADETINQSINSINENIGKISSTQTQQGTSIGENSEAIEGLQETTAEHTEDIAKNADDISKNAQDIASEVTNRTNAISDLSNSINGQIGTINTKLGELEEGFATADTALEEKITTAYNNAIDSKLQAADAMTFKGVINGDNSELTDLPSGVSEKVSAGDTYKVGKAGTYTDESVQAYVGDLFIALVDQGAEDLTYTGGWAHVGSGYESDYNPRLESIVTDNTMTIGLVGGAEEDLGQVAITANQNLKITSDANGAISVNMVWGSF